MEATTVLAWVGFNAFVLVLLAFDLGVLHKKPREINFREAMWLSALYFALAMCFALLLRYWKGPGASVEFLTGYLIEKALSLDNIFVILLIFTHFQVPLRYQHRVLFYGIIGALILRATLILAGIALIHTFDWVIYIFGAFLVFTGIKMLIAVDAEPDLENNAILNVARRRLRVTQEFEGDRFFVRQGAVLYATPLFLILILVETTDLVFAVDSIPAILSITLDPFIVYTSNVFAILGLRALYFALAGMIRQFFYLKYALSLVLIMIGAKMIINGAFGGKVIATEWALLMTCLLIAGGIIMSLLRTGRKSAPGAWVPGSASREPGVKEETQPERTSS